MPEISAAMVKELRDATNVSMMECKRALQESGGDMAKATRLLREKGVAVATKRASRAANQGIVASASTDEGNTVSLVEVNCETDFVARNESFKAFVAQIAGKACSTDAALADIVKEYLVAKIAEIGENIVVRRHVRYQQQGCGRIAAYIHMGGKVGVLVEIGCERNDTVGSPLFLELVKDLTLHVAASRPRYLDAQGVPPDEIAAEREIYAKQVHDKPAAIVDKIVDGKMKKFYADVCLLDQPFVKEPKESVRDHIAAVATKLGDALVVRRFARYQLGE